MAIPLRVQRIGPDLVVVLPPEEAAARQVREGDEVIVIKTTDQTRFHQALEDILHEHAGTFEFLRDK